MDSFGNTIAPLILFFVVWLLFVAIFMGYIRSEAKKKYRKNEKKYPYFSYPIYKKIFMVGLKGAVNPTITICTFVLNITLIIMIPLAIWLFVNPVTIISYIYRALVTLFVVVFFLRLIFFLSFPIKF